MTCPQLMRERIEVPRPPSTSLGRKSGLLQTLPQLHPNPPNIYKVLLNHRHVILSDMLTDDSREADRVVTPSL